MNQNIIFPGEEWEVKLPEELGMDKDAFTRLDREIRGRIKRIHSFLVIKDGYLVYENYYKGEKPDQLFETMSATKSFLSSLIGIAIEKKFIQGTEQAIMDFFEEYNSNSLDFFYEELTVEHLLTMTTGIFWDDGTKGSEKMCERLNRHPDWVNFILSLKIQPELLDKFRYSSANSHLLSAILTKASGESAYSFAKTNLFKPIGIGESRWKSDPAGISEGSSWLALTARDQARFGWLYLNNGYWNGKSVVPSEWVKRSVTAKNNGNELGDYGYQWWIHKDKNKGYFAMGYGGQYIAVIPEENMVAVITSDIRAIKSDFDNPLHLIYRHLL